MNEYQPVQYTESLAGIEASQLTGGFFVDWPNPPSPEMHLRLLQGSSHTVLAIDERPGETAPADLLARPGARHVANAQARTSPEVRCASN